MEKHPVVIGTMRVAILVLIALLMLPCFSRAEDGHVYLNGTISEFREGMILLSFGDDRGCAACLCKNVAYLKHVERYGAIYEEASDSGAVSKNKKATIMLIHASGESKCQLPSKLPFVNVCKENMCVSKVFIEEYRK